MKFTLIIFTVALLAAGCSEPKADAGKLQHAIALVDSGYYQEGLDELSSVAKISPNDPALKVSLIAAHMKYGHFFMFNDTLPPKVKYPSALKQYREVLKLDPNIQEAKDNAQQIIDIYKMMGREVPEV
jgi:tetratricopeptide (TPR) repeat protein